MMQKLRPPCCGNEQGREGAGSAQLGGCARAEEWATGNTSLRGLVGVVLGDPRGASTTARPVWGMQVSVAAGVPEEQQATAAGAGMGTQSRETKQDA